MAFTDFSNDHLVGIIVFASVMATLGLQILLESVRQLLSKMVQLKGNPQTNSAYLIKLELLVAKNLIAANLNGTSDPYAIITCGTEKRFSSMVLSSRNPMWGEEFNFAVEELPIEVVIMIYDPYHSYSYGSKT
ncbi:BAG-associated GRAM protein 1 isoform X2 [Quercus suber]|uniref:BAG-associated GRAM protein 1 isoform X2 n=1 Tax=Quercus suber TaxID=58331 RepID=UPI000CE1CAF7|nr:BAG-associated GRAM protein 1-like isoform X2 [Quercus suber]